MICQKIGYPHWKEDCRLDPILPLTKPSMSSLVSMCKWSPSLTSGLSSSEHYERERELDKPWLGGEQVKALPGGRAGPS